MIWSYGGNCKLGKLAKRPRVKRPLDKSHRRQPGCTFMMQIKKYQLLPFTPDKNSRWSGGTTACSPTTLPRNSRLATLLLVMSSIFFRENRWFGLRKRLFSLVWNVLRRYASWKKIAVLREFVLVDLDELGINYGKWWKKGAGDRLSGSGRLSA